MFRDVHVQQVFIVSLDIFRNYGTLRVSWGLLGSVGTVLGVFGPSWALWGPKNGLRVPQERTQSSPRARFSKIMISLQRGLDVEALRTRRNSRNPERTRAKR